MKAELHELAFDIRKPIYITYRVKDDFDLSFNNLKININSILRELTSEQQETFKWMIKNADIDCFRLLRLNLENISDEYRMRLMRTLDKLKCIVFYWVKKHGDHVETRLIGSNILIGNCMRLAIDKVVEYNIEDWRKELGI